MLLIVRDHAPGPFYEMLGQTHVNGGVVLLSLKMEVRLVIFSPFRLEVLQWSRHLFNYWKNKKTIIEEETLEGGPKGGGKEELGEEE